MRVVVIGCGGWGSRVAGALHRNTFTELVGVYDKDKSRADGVASDLSVKSFSVDELSLCGLCADAAVLATPPDSGRYKQLHALSEAGIRSVRVEKPLCVDPVESARIAKDFPDLITVGHTTLHQDANEYIRGAYSSIIGDISMFYERASVDPSPTGLSAFDDLAPHDIAYFLNLVGMDPSEVSYSGSAARLYFDDNGRSVECMVGSCYHANEKRRSLTIIGDGQVLSYDEMSGELMHNGRQRVFRVGDSLDREITSWAHGETVSSSFGNRVVQVMDQIRCVS